MAIYSRPMGVDPFKGSQGGVTFQVAGPSSSVRVRRIPRNIRTVRNSLSRNAFTHVRSNYQTLNSQQKSGWDFVSSEYPRVNSLGEVYTVSGTNVFTRLNKVLVEQGFDFEKKASFPATFPDPTIDIVAMEVAPVDILFQLSPVTVPFNYNYIVSGSAPLDSPPSNPSNITVFESHTFIAPESTASNAGTGWAAKFGDNSSYNGKFVVLTLRQVYIQSGDQRELFRVVVEIGA